MTKDEAMAWLKSFINEVDTQDNLWTAQPVQFLLQQKREYVADGDYHHTTTAFKHPEMEPDDGWFETEDDCIKFLKEDKEYEGEKLAEEIEKIETIYLGHYWETSQSFFTKRGFEEHVRCNRHNLGEHRPYVVHAFRNWENQELFKAIRAILKESEASND
jgi:hypothetical protein